MPRLEPATGVVQYELSTSLFTDYSEKQRLIKLPKKTRIVARGNGLPTFPDGTILAKTFHYPNSFNENDTMRKIVETRLLVKKDGQWNAATYQWEQLCAMHIYLKMARKRQLATK